MCGINIIFNPSGYKNSDLGIVTKMNQQMSYRGPDSHTVLDLSKVVFGHVRLSIIGLQDGSQPISNEDDTIYVICNGEIYNFSELKCNLEELGHVFKTTSDTEVILHLYEQYGYDMFDYINGMFAFAIWDINKQELLIARDRYGKKPLYYSKTSHGIVFSSEIKAIKNCFLESSSVNVGYIQSVLEFSYPTSPKDTYLNEIYKLKPGNYIRCNADVFEEKEYYWEGKKNILLNINPKKNIFENTYQLLTASVERRLQSEVPVAIMLSGGVDSSAVASIAKKIKDEVHVLSVGYKGDYKEIDERDVARRFAKDKGLIYHEIELNNNDFKRYFEEYIEIIDEPIADISAFSQWGIYKKASELGFKVLLSGLGSDEIFFGYESHNRIGDMIDKYDGLGKYFKKENRNLYEFLILYILKNGGKIKNITLNDFRKHFLVHKEHEFVGKPSFNSDFYFHYLKEGSGVQKVYSYLLNVWLINNCFHLADKLAMGNSIEVRAPFIDINLVSYVKSLDFNQIYREGQPKWFLKQVLREELPEYILNPVKKGFTPPLPFVNEIINNKKYSDFFKREPRNYTECLIASLM